MLLQDEQYIVHWLTQYGPLPQTQIVSLLRHKPPEVAAKIIRGLKRQQMIFDIAGGSIWALTRWDSRTSALSMRFGSCSSLLIRWNPWPTIRPLTHPSYSF